MIAVLTFVSLVALASQVAAFQSRTPEQLTGLANRAVALVPRQSIDPSAFPSQCQNGCTSIINTLTSCNGATSCICTSANVDDVQSCVNCIVSAAPAAAVISEGQTVINTLNKDCANTSVQSVTLSMTGTASGSGSSSTAPAGAKSGAAALTSSLSTVGLVGAFVLGGVAAIL